MKARMACMRKALAASSCDGASDDQTFFSVIDRTRRAAKEVPSEFIWGRVDQT